MEKLAYTINELADKGVGRRSSIYKMINSGKLRARKRGRSTIILHEDAEECLKNLPEYVPEGGGAVEAPDAPAR
ncbi:MAG: helix-turn-helix domain-containing protein [Rhodospirillales bacterium]|jgi:hypothetical protein|nr:helix-turn-helix domain-containing protein [Rhodospirillales bacterium]